MKSKLTKSISLRQVVVATLCLVALHACNKNDAGLEGAYGEAQLTIDFMGVEALVDTEKLNKAGASALQSGAAQSSLGDALSETTTYAYDGVDMAVSATEGWGDEGYASVSKKAAKAGFTKGAMAANETMKPNIKYRMLLYSNVNGQLTFATSHQFSSGTAAKIDLVKGGKYQWIAYSYNDDQDVPEPADLNTPTLQTATDRELIWATGEVVAELGNKNIPLTFKRRLGAVLVSVDARGMFGTITALSGRFKESDYIKTGTFDLLAGTSSNPQSANITTINFVNSPVHGEAVKQAFYYTSHPSNLTSFVVTLNGLSAKNSAGQTKNIITTATNYTFSGYTPALGKKLNANMNLLDNTVTVAGIRWARGILYYTTGGEYRFRPPNYGEIDASNYWAYNATTPSSGPNTGGDPCARVYPEGTWRLPTTNEYTALQAPTQPNGLPADPTKYQSNFDYTAYKSDTNPNDYLRVYDLGSFNQLPPFGIIFYDQFNRWAHYWSSSRFNIQTMNDIYHSYKTSGGTVIHDIQRDTWPHEWRHNIRCVRN